MVWELCGIEKAAGWMAEESVLSGVSAHLLLRGARLRRR